MLWVGPAVPANTAKKRGRAEKPGLRADQCTNPLLEPQWRETQGAAAKASIALMPFEFRSVDQLDASSPRGARSPDEIYSSWSKAVAEKSHFLN